MREAICYLVGITLLIAELVTANASAAAFRKCKKAPSSHKYKCGVKGRHKGGFNNKPVCDPAFVSSAAECAYLCSRRAQNDQHAQDDVGFCASFEYDSTRSSCTLFDKHVKDLLDPKFDGRPRDYFDQGCYTCGPEFCTAPGGQPYGAQLLDNPGFETKKFHGPWIFGPGVKLVHNRTSKNTYVRGGVIQQNVNVCDQEYYEYSFDYKYSFNKDTGNRERPSVSTDTPQLRAAGFQTGFGKISSTQGQWRRGRFIYQAQSFFPETPQYSHFGPQFRLDRGMSIDNVVLSRRAPKFPRVPGGEAHFPNSGFESGSGAPWTLNNKPLPDSSIKSPGLQGSKYALRLTFTEDGNDAYLTNGVTGKAHSWYMLSVTIENTVVAPHKYPFIQPMVRFENSGTFLTKEFPNLQDFNHTYSWPFFAREASSQIHFHLFAVNTTLIVDNFKLEELNI